ncbi:MAG: family 1 glycosylhydrolase, partial [Candidatus Aenigmarchaeota archaeon]|nr:family 1 glycosylhydrolase [Candidatus Aenigmarchaeota archaeon]
MKTKYKFPKGFEWGADASAYQTEGAWNEDGKGESIWDRFCHKPGNILNGDTGDVACDHYHRYEKDIEIMKELGLKAYRFSISWPRIFPKGSGKPNKKGLDFYKRLVKKLLEAGIKPMACLYHFDLPQALQEKDGWVNRDITEHFENYAKFIFKELNSVKKWMTINEPFSIVNGGYIRGHDAPGIRDMKQAIQVMHNILVSHGKAVNAYREMNLDGEIGIGLSFVPIYPKRKEDEHAAKMADNFRNGWFSDPILKGAYPKELFKKFQQKWGVPVIKKGDLEITSTPLDFMGVNYYYRYMVERDENNVFGFKRINPKGAEYDAMGWEIYHQGLYDLLLRLKKDYKGIPIYITEGGAAFDDKLEKSRVHD